jgi:hypothetical protein
LTAELTGHLSRSNPDDCFHAEVLLTGPDEWIQLDINAGMPIGSLIVGKDKLTASMRHSRGKISTMPRSDRFVVCFDPTPPSAMRIRADW